MERKNKEVSACEPRCAGNKWQWRCKQQQGACQWGNAKLVSWWTKVEIIGIWNTFIISIHVGESCINSTCPCFISSLQWLELSCWPEQWLLSLPAEFELMYSSVMSFWAGFQLYEDIATVWRKKKKQTPLFFGLCCIIKTAQLNIWVVLNAQRIRKDESLCQFIMYFAILFFKKKLKFWKQVGVRSTWIYF